jgi:predicted SAM-dependent methyltransferase
MIEHLDYPQGLHVLNECYRVLRHEGRLRISTPDLAFFMSLYTDFKSDLQIGFIKHSTDTHIPWAPCYKDTFVINNYMRDWDHRFIYDEKVLRAAMEKVGFKNVTRQNLCGSDEEELRNLENIHRKPLDFLKLESLILEGIKP